MGVWEVLRAVETGVRGGKREGFVLGARTGLVSATKKSRYDAQKRNIAAALMSETFSRFSHIWIVERYF